MTEPTLADSAPAVSALAESALADSQPDSPASDSPGADTPAAETPGSRRLRRGATIVTAIVVAVLDWVVCSKIIGLDLMVDQGAGPQPVLLPMVALAPIASGLTGWALLALLERLAGARGRTAWRVIAAVVLVLSNTSPILMALSPGTAAALVSMHVLVGLTLIIGLAGLRRPTARSRR